VTKIGITYHSSVIFVEDIEVAKEFYKNLLQQEIDFDFGKNVTFKSGITIWELRENHVITKNLDVKNNKSHRFELYFECDDLERVLKQLESNNVSLLHPIHEEPWGQRTMRFFDPDNHLVEVGESLHTFVKRFSDQGLSIEEINNKTGISKKDIQRILKNKA
jgi:catechol 2,3-dioxygenase-like lactoylglutathione lyase family enzyme